MERGQTSCEHNRRNSVENSVLLLSLFRGQIHWIAQATLDLIGRVVLPQPLMLDNSVDVTLVSLILHLLANCHLRADSLIICQLCSCEVS